MSRSFLAYTLSIIVAVGLCVAVYECINDDGIRNGNTSKVEDSSGDKTEIRFVSESDSLQVRRPIVSSSIAVSQLFTEKHFTVDRTDSLCTKAGKLLVSEGRLLRDVTLSVRSLSDSELPELDYA